MSNEQPIRVILADDHIRTHEFVTLLLETVEDIQLVGQASNGQEAYELCEQLQPDIVLMDVMMAVMNGIEATKKIHERFPYIKILVLSSFQDDDSVLTMLHSGAVGYLLKGSLTNELLDTLRAVKAGKNVFSSEITQMLLQAPSHTETYRLTERELSVLRLIAGGYTNQQIANQLFISPSTVKFHLANILTKMGVETRSESIVLAVKMGLI
jgi:NarL family two-component system response regulator LiaR